MKVVRRFDCRTLVLLAQMSGAVFVSCRSQSPPAEPLSSPNVSPPASARPSTPSEDTLPALLAAAPELTEESANLLRSTVSNAGREAATLAQVSLLEATAGFAHLPPNELRELSSLFAAAYQHLGTGDRRRLESYLVRVRGGDVGDADEGARARRLFNAAILGLAPSERERLQVLYAHAIAASLAAKKVGARQVLELPTVVAAGSEPVETPTPPSGRNDYVKPLPPAPRVSANAEEAEEAAKRARAAGYKSSLQSADRYLKQAEDRLKWAEEHWQFVNSHTNQSYPLDEARRKLADAKREFERARKQKEDIEDAAHREGIPPGWLR